MNPPDSNPTDQLLQQAWQMHRAGRHDAAEQGYRNILSRSPGHSDANNLMGLLFIETRRPKLARKYIRRALRSDPGNPQSHFNLGIACKDLGEWGEAARHFDRASRLRPGHPEPLSNLGNALRHDGRPGEAVEALRAALQQVPNHRGARQNLGLALNDLGVSKVKARDIPAARACFEEAVELTPHHPQALMNLGLTLEQSGDLDEAARRYRAAIAARPDFADPHFHLAHLRAEPSTPAEIEAMRALISRPGLENEDRVRLAFGLGFACESAGEFEEAFRWMTEGHRLQGKDVRFSLAEEAQGIGRLMSAFSPARIAELARSGHGDDRPVLIVGMPRSGTTLVEQILASHPEVHGAGEHTALHDAARSVNGRSGRATRGEEDFVDAGRLAKAGRRYMERISPDANLSSGSPRRVTDTTPMNFLLVGLAAALLPGARFVFCLRDPRDNCLSLYRQYLTGAYSFTHSLADLGGYYLLHRKLLDHWEAALPGRVHRVQYERMVRNPDSEIASLLEFCGLPFDDDCLRFYETSRVVRSPSAALVRQPLHERSIGAWRRYEQHLEPLLRGLQAEGESE